MTKYRRHNSIWVLCGMNVVNGLVSLRSRGSEHTGPAGRSCGRCQGDALHHHHWDLLWGGWRRSRFQEDWCEGVYSSSSKSWPSEFMNEMKEVCSWYIIATAFMVLLICVCVCVFRCWRILRGCMGNGCSVRSEPCLPDVTCCRTLAWRSSWPTEVRALSYYIRNSIFI